MDDHNYKFGFTLAEVLITLGIIGVVAAITIPNLIAHYKAKVMETQFKKVYSTISNATKMLESEGIQVHQELLANGQDYCVDQYFRVIGGKLCEWDNKDCKFEAVKNLTGDFENSFPFYVGRYIVTKDNAAIFCSHYQRHYLIVDIDGKHRGPNRHGHDIHYFRVNAQNNVEPLKAGRDHDACPCSITVANGYSGTGCSEYAVLNKNPDGEGDYWYNFLKTAK